LAWLAAESGSCWIGLEDFEKEFGDGRVMYDSNDALF